MILAICPSNTTSEMLRIWCGKDSVWRLKLDLSSCATHYRKRESSMRRQAAEPHLEDGGILSVSKVSSIAALHGPGRRKQQLAIVEYSERAYGVAMSNHADFEGTLDYVRATKARFVVTDNTRKGKGYELAEAIKQRLGIEARPSSGIETREWGGSPL